MTKKISYGCMALIDWLLEKPNTRAFKSSLSNSHWPLHLYEATEVNEEGKPVFKDIYPNNTDLRVPLLERLGGRDKIETYPIQHLCNKRSLGSTFIMTATRQLKEHWESDLADDFKKQKASKDAYRQSVSRQVILGRRGSLKPQISKELADRVPHGVVLPLPARPVLKPRYIATVVKESPTRVYLTDVKPLVKVDSYTNPIICGHAPNQYAAVEDILADNADEHLADRLVSLVAEFQQEINAVANRTVEEILPAIQTMNDRFIQKDAALDDMMRELIDRNTSDNSGPSMK